MSSEIVFEELVSTAETTDKPLGTLAGLSVGLMYGNGGGQAASTAGGDGMQPSGPKMNPVEAALQQQANRAARRSDKVSDNA